MALLVCASGTHAKWQDPGDRYIDEYNKHENALCPIAKSDTKHFVYFAGDRRGIIDHPLLTSDSFSGAQIMYPWAELEPEKGDYDFSQIESDFQYLKRHNKKLFVQLQDATFSPDFKGVPDYLLTEEYGGGITAQLTGDGEHEGWVAKRWNANVQERFSQLIQALGKQFDGRIEGINLQESAIGVKAKTVPDFTNAGYVEALKTNMLALKSGFKNSVTIQYANFMPGEWLPWDDEGYLKAIYEHGEAIGVGLGAPDLMPRRKGQLNHALAMMHEHEFSVPLSIAVQDGNYIGKTNNMDVLSERKNLVPGLTSFAEEFLHVDYMFWVNQAPYFEHDVMPCFDG